MLVEVGRLTVDQPVNGVTHVTNNANIFEAQHSPVGTDNSQKLGNFLSFLKVGNIAVATDDGPCIEVEMIHHLADILIVLLVVGIDFQVIATILRIVDGTSC